MPSLNAPFLVVGVGASAGGLQALEAFFRPMPADAPMAFVVAQHLSPHYKSAMPELLQRHCALRVRHAEEGDAVEPGVVHLIPPGKNLTVQDGCLHLVDQPETRSVNLPIDILFRSLAEDAGEASVAIVLSGTGTDGTLGLRDVRGAGGLVMVQEPGSAQYDGMPRSAMATRLVDFVKRPEEMAPTLLQYASYPAQSRAQAEAERDDAPLRQLLAQLELHSGIDFTGYRRSTILRRLDKRMQTQRFDSLSAYLMYVENHPSEAEALASEVLIGVTRFFRDPETFDLLRREVIPKLWKRYQEDDSQDRRELRVWSAACSTGEEAYTLAILLLEGARKLGIDPHFKVFATDVSKTAIKAASQGVYPESIKADVPADLLNEYLHRTTDRYVVNDSVRRRVIFSVHDLTWNPPFNRIDLLSCRNVLIYLKSDVQKRVLSNFCFSLRDQSYLLLGSSESLSEHEGYFDPIDRRAKLFRYLGGGRTAALGFSPVPRHASPVSQRTAQNEPGYSTVERGMLRHIMQSYAPATAIVNDRHQVKMTFGDIQRYLRLPPGRISVDLLNMATGTLSALLGTAMHNARRSKRRVEYPRVRLNIDRPELVRVVVDPLPETALGEQLYAVIIAPMAADAEAGESSEQLTDEHGAHLADLERELQYTKENLQATIEELETANEELQATNEELLASNEELQSTNEELQSVNEELITVNAEHQLRIGELTEAGNDFDNLLVAAEIHTIFLDRSLCIRKFSQGEGPFHFVAGDVGRPLRHFAIDLDYPDLHDDVEIVRQTLIPKEGVHASGEQFYLVRIVPYRTREDEIRGVVVMMIDVTERQSAFHRLQELERVTESYGRPIEILLIDDDEEQSRLMRAALAARSLRNRVHVVTTGEAATAFLEQRAADGLNPPDLVLLDLVLPDGHGLDWLARTRKTELGKHLTVVVVSSLDGQKDVDRAYELGAVSYITKPITLQTLTDAISALGTYWLSLVSLPTKRSTEHE